jgi:tyrosyl-tRNA synthetase
MNLAERQQANPGAREAQKTLAYEVTKLVHGQDRTESVMRVTDVLFGSGDFANLTTDDLNTLAAEIMTVPQGMSVVDALQKAGLASSNGEARRLISGGAVSVNGEKLDEDKTIDEVALIKKGKNNFVLVRS